MLRQTTTSASARIEMRDRRDWGRGDAESDRSPRRRGLLQVRRGRRAGGERAGQARGSLRRWSAREPTFDCQEQQEREKSRLY